MDVGTTAVDDRSVRRGTIMGYLIALLGLMFTINAGLSALDDGVTVRVASGLAAGAITVAGGVLHVHRNPSANLGMDEPADRSLYLVAVIATVTFLFWVVVRYGAV